MRLTADKIKQGILHSRQEVREACVLHFSEGFIHDPTVMSVFAQATEKYGWNKAFSPMGFPERLTQTDDSVDWVLAQTKRIAQSGDPDEGEHRLLYSYLLVAADIELLQRHEEKIFASETLHETVRRILYERLRLLRLSVDQCWQELEAFCEREKDTEFINDADLVYAEALCDALGRHGDELSDKVLTLLDTDVEEADLEDADLEDADGIPLTWMEGFAVRLAGEMRLAASVEKLVNKLQIDSEWLSDECQRSLILIGSDEVVDALDRAYADGDWSVRIVAASVLARIYSDRSSETLRKWMEGETETDLAVTLRQALLTRFDDEAVEIARQYVAHQPLTEDVADLRQDVLAVAELMKINFPEKEKWTRESVASVVERDQQTRQTEFPVVDQLDTLVAQKKHNDEVRRQRILKEAVPLPSSLLRHHGVGRNDPCPCGSGKKYKKCCLKI